MKTSVTYLQVMYSDVKQFITFMVKPYSAYYIYG